MTTNSRDNGDAVDAAHFKRGRKALPVVDRLAPRLDEWIDPPSFREALVLHLSRFSESYYQLHRAIIQSGETFDRSTLRSWTEGQRMPGSAASLALLTRIEQRYDLPIGYFKSKLPNRTRAPSGLEVAGLSIAEQRRVAWHLPDDFNSRSLLEQKKILNWVQNVVITGTTEYRRFQAQAMKLRYAIQFPSLTGKKGRGGPAGEGIYDLEDPTDHNDVVDAPPHLVLELAELVRLKTATLTDIGFQRSGVWNEETTSQKIEHFGLMFGALAASPTGAVHGCGVPIKHLSFSMLVFPRV